MYSKLVVLSMYDSYNTYMNFVILKMAWYKAETVFYLNNLLFYCINFILL